MVVPSALANALELFSSWTSNAHGGFELRDGFRRRDGQIRAYSHAAIFSEILGVEQFSSNSILAENSLRAGL